MGNGIILDLDVVHDMYMRTFLVLKAVPYHCTVFTVQVKSTMSDMSVAWVLKWPPMASTSFSMQEKKALPTG